MSETPESQPTFTTSFAKRFRTRFEKPDVMARAVRQEKIAMRTRMSEFLDQHNIDELRVAKEGGTVSWIFERGNHFYHHIAPHMARPMQVKINTRRQLEEILRDYFIPKD